jgi:hypothetical protein
MSERNTRLKTRLCALLVSVGAMLICSGMAVRAQNDQDPHFRIQDESVLHGSVQEMDHVVRLKRPATPLLKPPPALTTGLDKNNFKAAVDFGDTDFLKAIRKPKLELEKIDPQFEKLTPLTENLTPLTEKVTSLASKSEDEEGLIAWEAWHKRVCQAIYEEWEINSKIRGIAHTTLRFTRNHHIICSIQDVDVIPEMSNRPPWMAVNQKALEDEFVREIMVTVQSVDGNPILEFPAKSQRTETSMSPFFKKMGDSGFDWRKDDYEHVHLN